MNIILVMLISLLGVISSMLRIFLLIHALLLLLVRHEWELLKDYHRFPHKMKNELIYLKS